MRVLLALPYGPTPTRVRSRMLLSSLASRHDVTVLALVWGADDLRALREFAARGVDVHAIPHGRRRQIASLGGDPGRPIQQAIATSPRFARTARELVARASASGRPFDAVHVEHLRGAAAIDLLAGLDCWTVFDAVDCIAELARLSRQYAPSRLVRLISRIEEQRTRNLEHRLLWLSDVVTVTAERDRAALLEQNAVPGERVVVVPNGASTLPHPVPITRAPIVVFTGKLSYHANQAAVRHLIDAVWPHVRANVAEAQLLIAGAGAPRWVVELEQHPGVQVLRDPPNMQAVISSARVAVAPMTYSVGIQNKVLEAMGCGVPVVASPAALAGLRTEAIPGLRVAGNPSEMTDGIVQLLRNDTQAHELGARGFEIVRRYYEWDATARAFEDIYIPEHSRKMVA
jgi:glycosyltransferase involved in cell wall biosynthesis